MADKTKIEKPVKNYLDHLKMIILEHRSDLSENRKQENEQRIKLAIKKQIRKLIRYQPHNLKEEIMALLDLSSSQYDELLNFRKK